MFTSEFCLSHVTQLDFCRKNALKIMFFIWAYMYPKVAYLFFLPVVVPQSDVASRFQDLPVL